MDQPTSAWGPNAEPPGPGAQPREPDEPRVTHVLEGDVASISIAGELTEAARRPLVRTLTDLLLAVSTLRRVRLHLREVTFMNSAGTGVLVQLQKMTRPRGVELVLVGPPPIVVRPLQLTGLWTRFPVEDEP